MNITVRYIQELQRKRAELYGKVEKLDTAIKMLAELNGELPANVEEAPAPRVRRTFRRRVPVGVNLQNTKISMAFYHAKAVELIKAKGRPVTTAEVADALVKAGVDATTSSMSQKVYSSLYLDKGLVRIKGTGRQISWGIKGSEAEAK